MRPHASATAEAAPAPSTLRQPPLADTCCLSLPLSANDIAKESRRSTITAQDVLAALRELEFDDFLPTVESALAAFREQEKGRSIEAAAKRAAKLQAAGGSGGEGAAGADEGDEDVDIMGNDDDAGADADADADAE